VSSLVFACAVGAIYAVLAVGRAIQGAIEARRSDSAALRWSARCAPPTAMRPACCPAPGHGGAATMTKLATT
jgi:hypothetical protein